MELILLSIIAITLLFIAKKVNYIYTLVLVAIQKHSSASANEYNEDDYDTAKEFVIETGKASTSSLQTEFRWQYNRAAMILGKLESNGVIGPMRQGERYREVLIKED